MNHAAGPYVLLTAVYNEEAYIEGTIRSVAAQTVLPTRWVIVSDGCTDRTDEIVRRYAATRDYIYFLRKEKDQNRGFASKVFAQRDGMQFLNVSESSFIGHLDGDVTFEPTYFEDLLQKFIEDPKLGIAGGWILEMAAGQFRQRLGNSVISVPGAVQTFRRECYQDVGGLLPIEYGGEDWYAEVKARMWGWRVRSFSTLSVCHHRKTGEAGARLRYCYRQGFMDFALGSHPLFEFGRLIRRIPAKPYLIGAAARLLGFAMAHVSGRRMVPQDFIHFLRKEQVSRLWPRWSHRDMVP